MKPVTSQAKVFDFGVYSQENNQHQN